MSIGDIGVNFGSLQNTDHRVRFVAALAENKELAVPPPCTSMWRSAYCKSLILLMHELLNVL